MKIGCSGWSYKDWAGPFYPKDLPAEGLPEVLLQGLRLRRDRLQLLPDPQPVHGRAWKRATPGGLPLLSPKLSKKITHDNKLENFESTLMYFYSVVSKLGNKLGPIVGAAAPFGQAQTSTCQQ